MKKARPKNCQLNQRNQPYITNAIFHVISTSFLPIDQAHSSAPWLWDHQKQSPAYVAAPSVRRTSSLKTCITSLPYAYILYQHLAIHQIETTKWNQHTMMASNLGTKTKEGRKADLEWETNQSRRRPSGAYWRGPGASLSQAGVDQIPERPEPLLLRGRRSDRAAPRGTPWPATPTSPSRPPSGSEFADLRSLPSDSFAAGGGFKWARKTATAWGEGEEKIILLFPKIISFGDFYGSTLSSCEIACMSLQSWLTPMKYDY